MNKELVVLSYLCSTLFLLWSHVTHLFIWTHLGSCNWIYPASIYSLNVHHIFSPISKATHESHTPSYFPFHVGPHSNTSWSNSLSPNYLLFYLSFLRSCQKQKHTPLFIQINNSVGTSHSSLLSAREQKQQGNTCFMQYWTAQCSTPSCLQQPCSIVLCIETQPLLSAVTILPLEIQ